MPFLVLALAAGWHGETRILVLLLASLAQVAAWAGIARRARSEAAAHSAAHQVIAGTLTEHVARGERARITRELHDVVAHHISMVAVQAETARLTTQGMPAAGAQRLSSIGDTARAALTEMRRLLGVLRDDAESEVADRQPQPGLRQLNELLDESRDASGAGTRLIVRGNPVSSTRAWGSLPTASSRRRSPTRGGTLPGQLLTWKSATATANCGPAHPRQRAGTAADGADWRPRAARYAGTRGRGRRRAAAPGPRPSAASSSRPACPVPGEMGG